MNKFKKIIKMLIIILLPLIGGFLSTIFVNFKIYNNLNKPVLSPPKIVFPIAWSILYIIIGISLYYVNKDSYNKKITKIIIVNLLLNYIWTVIFFKFNLYIVAAIDLLLLIVSTVTLICELYKENKKIGISEIPYLLWLLFVFYLNLGIIFLN